MTAAPATPQQMKERLLQAIDTQSNIHNMVAVLEVISNLEKYPITKEALEETRLGKLINDVRKKTTNEDLAKRAKKLLRSWQKLIEPVSQNEPVPKGLPNPPGSANGGAHNCKQETAPMAVAVGTKPIQELKGKNDIQKLHSPKAEKVGTRKRKVDHKDGLQGPPSKVSKSSHEPFQNSSPPPTNGIGGSPESFPSPLDLNMHMGPEKSRTEQNENDKHGKIPVNAVKPHTSSPGLVKSSSTSSLLKTAVVQQLEKCDEARGQHQPRSPRCTSFSPRNIRQETFTRQHTTYAPKGSLASPSLRSQCLDTAQVPSPLPATQPSTPPMSVKRLEPPQQSAAETSPLRQEQATPDVHHRHVAGTLQPQHPSLGSQTSTHPGELAMPRLGFSPDPTRVDSDDAASGSDSNKKKKYRPRDYTVNLDGQGLEEVVKPVRLKKERKLTFDPMTGQIKPLTQKDSLQVESLPVVEQHRTEMDKQESKISLQSPFEQTNWEELSRNEIIQSYLNRQSSLLSSSGVQTPGAHYFMSEYLKQEESTRREARKTHVLVPNILPTDLPGVSREVTNDDLKRIHIHRWPGVNGCYDTQGNWYDWTQCVSLDPHGDEGRLNVLPYVCLD
ncbi:mediator of RNA polymerase II transcription subunit 26 [Rhinatrema bivittatum]|uniref:mediator of RNA polymerase II transcription subunit 26 n=1 Tax=Rhinatrema bivittatum TaxID=194408 RepID=UPI0011281B3D|nr:mediator of RNA polymerase II transcription subunit 26 [Rhinatrema bivittatum]